MTFTTPSETFGSRKKRLGVVLHTSFFRDGGCLYLKELWADYIIECLAPCFEHTVVLGPIQTGSQAGRFQFQPFGGPRIQVIELPTQGIRPLRAIASVVAVARFVRASDTVWILAPAWRGVLSAAFCWLLSRDYVLYVGGDWAELPPTGAPMRQIRLFVERAVARRARFILCAGEVIFDRLRRSGRPVIRRVPPMRLTLAHLYRREDSISTAGVRLLYVGSLGAHKGVEYLIRALPILRARGLTVECDLVGPGTESDRERLRSIAKLCVAEESVHHWGYLPNGPELFGRYREASVFVLPTLSEGFPRVLFEAMGHGVPIISTAVGGIPDALRDGADCLLVSPRSPEQIAEAVVQLVTQPLLRKRIIARGYEIVERELAQSPGQQVAELLSTFGLI